MDYLSKGHMLADTVAIIGSLDIVFGEIDKMSGNELAIDPAREIQFSAENLKLIEAIIAKYPAGRQKKCGHPTFRYRSETT